MESKFLFHYFIISFVYIFVSSTKECTKEDIGKMVLDCTTSENKREGKIVKNLNFSNILLERIVHSK